MKRRSCDLTTALAQLDHDHLRRRRQTVTDYAEPDSRLSLLINGHPVVDFSSNDYLGLARHPALTQALIDCARHAGVGTGASHLITGHGLEHDRLEAELADFTGHERALLFSTGYMANLAVMTALAGRGERVLLDRLSHASLIDGGLLSGARFKRYAHADAAAATAALDDGGPTTALLATDGVFSMDGDVAPLPELALACRQHDAWLVVDDAHGLGVIGATGRGCVEQFGMDQQAVPVLVGTLGKAFGCAGAFVAGCSELIDYIMQHARSYIYTTALPQPIAAAARAALQLAQRESWRREKLLALAGRFRSGARQLDIPVAQTAHMTAIQPVLLGSSQQALRAQHELYEAGFAVVAIRPPTVPRGGARLRVTLSAAHTENQVDRLLEALSRTCAKRELAVS